MKRIILFLSILLFSLSSLFAQTLYTRTDSIAITSDSVTLKSGQYRGSILWQHSIDGQIWSNLTGKTDTLLKVSKADEGYYRAQLTDGTCLPTYSDTAVIVVPKPANTMITDPDEVNGNTFVERDDSTFTFISSGATIPLNTVFVDNNQESDIQVVKGIVQNGDTIIASTTPGTMEDLFFNQDFKLSTELMDAPLKSAYLSNSALSKALTDKDGFIHPAEVYNSDGAKLKSAFIDGEIPIVNINKDLTGEKLYDKNGVELTITDGYYYLGTVLKCEFNFEQQKFLWTKLPTGRLISCKFYTDPEKTGAKSKLIVQAKASGEVSINETFVLKPKVFKLPFKFFVGEVPVWMEVKIDLMARVVGYLKSEFSITGGASSDLGINLGAEYANGSWNPFFKYSKDFQLYGPDYDGHINYDMLIEVYPRTEITFYYTLGPVLEIVPYLSEHMDCSISGNYNFGLYAGLDARVGVTGNIMGHDISNLPMMEFKIKKDTLYQQPSKLEIVSGNNQAGTTKKKLGNPIVVKVTDSAHQPIADVPVNFNTSSGSVDNDAPKTNIKGEVSVYWTLGSNEGEQTLEAFLKDGNDNKLDFTAVTITAESKSEPPALITNEISEISETSAFGGGNITNDGGADVTARGVCWNTTGTPTIDDNKTSNGAGTGEFTSGLSGLTAGTTYYVRAYAINSKGIGYGNQVRFTTKSAITITTSSVTDITKTTATCGGIITSDKTITARGVCWNTTGSPTISNSKTTDGSGTGSFSSSLSNLTSGTTYYVRAYATNSKGTGYGSQISFTTSSTQSCGCDESKFGYFTDSRDGHTYKTIKIGTQTWMAENLAYLPYSTSISTQSNTSPCYYVYDYAAYGVLYNWPAALTACPAGWHLPSSAEWITLEDYLCHNGYGYEDGYEDSWSYIAKAVASATGWNSSSSAGTPGNDPGSNNSSCFSALPGGYFCYGYGFSLAGYRCCWRSSTADGELSAWCCNLDNSDTSLNLYGYYRGYGISVRCVRD